MHMKACDPSRKDRVLFVSMIIGRRYEKNILFTVGSSYDFHFSGM